MNDKNDNSTDSADQEQVQYVIGQLEYARDMLMDAELSLSSLNDDFIIKPEDASNIASEIKALQSEVDAIEGELDSI